MGANSSADKEKFEFTTEDITRELRRISQIEASKRSDREIKVNAEEWKKYLKMKSQLEMLSKSENFSEAISLEQWNEYLKMKHLLTEPTQQHTTIYAKISQPPGNPIMLPSASSAAGSPSVTIHHQDPLHVSHHTPLFQNDVTTEKINTRGTGAIPRSHGQAGPNNARTKQQNENTSGNKRSTSKNRRRVPSNKPQQETERVQLATQEGFKNMFTHKMSNDDNLQNQQQNLVSDHPRSKSATRNKAVRKNYNTTYTNTSFKKELDATKNLTKTATKITEKNITPLMDTKITNNITALMDAKITNNITEEMLRSLVQNNMVNSTENVHSKEDIETLVNDFTQYIHSRLNLDLLADGKKAVASETSGSCLIPMKLSVSKVKAQLQCGELKEEEVRTCLPKNWDLASSEQSNLNQIKVVEIGRDSQDFLDLVLLFHKTVNYEVKIKAIHRIENAPLWYTYTKSKEAVLELVKLHGISQPNELFSFHGNSEYMNKNIIESGFGWYGKGPKPASFKVKKLLSLNAKSAAIHARSSIEGMDKGLIVARELKTSYISKYFNERKETPSNILEFLDDCIAYPTYIITFSGSFSKKD